MARMVSDEIEGPSAGFGLNKPREHAGYLESGGAHLYAVLHEVAEPVARVLLAGPFAAERHFSYVPWVRWARFLAARGIETLRFDYRGVGESTGVFEEMAFGDWMEDLELVAGWLKRRSPEAPLILHGLELGALLASKAFAGGLGDALLLWSLPANANEVMRRSLSRRIAVDQFFKSAEERKPLSAYLRQLDAGEPVEVEGYLWSGKLWRESLRFEVPRASPNQAETAWDDGRPLRQVILDRSAAPLVKGSSLGYIVSLNPDLNGLFSENFEWMARTVAAGYGGQQ